jgi:hypothetical protein
MVLAHPRVGPAEDVQVGAVVHRVAHLPPGEQRLQRERAGEGQDRLRVRGGVERVAHDLVDEAGHAEQLIGDRRLLFPSTGFSKITAIERMRQDSNP